MLPFIYTPRIQITVMAINGSFFAVYSESSPHTVATTAVEVSGIAAAMKGWQFSSFVLGPWLKIPSELTSG